MCLAIEQSPFLRTSGIHKPRTHSLVLLSSHNIMNLWAWLENHHGYEEVKWSEITQSCPTFCDPVDYSPPGSSVHGVLQARVLEWVAISFSRGSSQPRDRTQVSHIAGRCFNLWATKEVCFSSPKYPAHNMSWWLTGKQNFLMVKSKCKTSQSRDAVSIVLKVLFCFQDTTPIHWKYLPRISILIILFCLPFCCF